VFSLVAKYLLIFSNRMFGPTRLSTNLLSNSSFLHFLQELPCDLLAFFSPGGDRVIFCSYLFYFFRRLILIKLLPLSTEILKVMIRTICSCEMITSGSYCETIFHRW
jgi:hypothetical protein